MPDRNFRAYSGRTPVTARIWPDTAGATRKAPNRRTRRSGACFTLVAGAGFEPAKAYADGFTVRFHWPLGQPAMLTPDCLWHSETKE